MPLFRSNNTHCPISALCFIHFCTLYCYRFHFRRKRTESNRGAAPPSLPGLFLPLATIDKVFELDGGNWDTVINLAAATKYSQANEVRRSARGDSFSFPVAFCPVLDLRPRSTNRGIQTDTPLLTRRSTKSTSSMSPASLPLRPRSTASSASSKSRPDKSTTLERCVPVSISKIQGASFFLLLPNSAPNFPY